MAKKSSVSNLGDNLNDVQQELQDSGWRKNYTWDYTKDADYLAALEKYKDHPLVANLENMSSLKGSGYLNFWEQLGENLLGSQHIGNYTATAYQNYKTELANVIQQLEAANYNSPVEQTKREQAAGINTDINSAGINSGSVEDVEQALNPLATRPTPDGVNDVEMAFKGVTSLITGTLSLGQAIQGLRSNALENGMKELSLDDAAMDYAIESIINSLPFTIESDDDIDRLLGIGAYKEGEHSENGRLLDVAINSSHYRYSSPYVRKAMRRLSGMLQSNSLAIRGKAAEMLKNYYSNRFGAAEVKSRPDYDDSFTAMIDKIGNITNKYYEEIIDIDQKYRKGSADAAAANAKSAEAKAGYDTDFYGSVSEDGQTLGAAAGAAAHSSYASNKQKAEYEAAEDEMWNNILDALKDEKSWWATAARFLVPIIRGYLKRSTFTLHPSLPSAPAQPSAPTYPSGSSSSTFTY